MCTNTYKYCTFYLLKVYTLYFKHAFYSYTCTSFIISFDNIVFSKPSKQTLLVLPETDYLPITSHAALSSVFDLSTGK